MFISQVHGPHNKSLAPPCTAGERYISFMRTASTKVHSSSAVPCACLCQLRCLLLFHPYTNITNACSRAIAERHRRLHFLVMCRSRLYLISRNLRGSASSCRAFQRVNTHRMSTLTPVQTRNGRTIARLWSISKDPSATHMTAKATSHHLHFPKARTLMNLCPPV